MASYRNGPKVADGLDERYAAIKQAQPQQEQHYAAWLASGTVNCQGYEEMAAALGLSLDVASGGLAPPSAVEKTYAPPWYLGPWNELAPNAPTMASEPLIATLRPNWSPPAPSFALSFCASLHDAPPSAEFFAEQTIKSDRQVAGVQRRAPERRVAV